MKRKLEFFVPVVLCLFACKGFSQDTTQPPRYQVAIFTPLYLDSAFDQSFEYRYNKNFPKFFNPGLEFFEGAQAAIDSLNKEGIPLDIFVYDTRSEKSGISTVVSNSEFDSIDLIIGQVNANDAKLLANAASDKNIPFINATYPNEAGVSNNPNYIILNSTLYTHCNAMYKFIQKNYALSPIILFRKKGAQEDRLQNYFQEISKSTASVPLKIKYVTLEDDFTADDVKEYLGKDATTVCIAGSLDLNFGMHLTGHLSSLYDDYTSILFGMPTWWDVANFSKPGFNGIEVLFTTPFYLPSTNALGTRLSNGFKTKFYSRPTDMFFRGYETLYHFAHLLQLNGKNIGSGLSDKRFRVFTDFDIQPVIDPKTSTLDYFENKKIYIIRKVDGVVTEENE